MILTALSLICARNSTSIQEVSFSDFRFEKPTVDVKKKTERVSGGYWEKPGFLKRTIQVISLGMYKPESKWVDTSYDKEVIDVTRTQQSINIYIKLSKEAIRQTIERWNKSIELTEEKLFAQLDNRRKEYEARKNKALDSQAYFAIGKELQRLAGEIKDYSERRTNVCQTKTDVNIRTFNANISKEVVAIYRLSDSIRLRIHHETCKYLLESTGVSNSVNIMIGWDEFCESNFCKYAFNQAVPAEQIRIGLNDIRKDIRIIHKPKNAIPLQPALRKNIFLLVNATQIGAAENEISKISLSQALGKNDNLFLIVQDFQEIITGGVVEETLDSMIRLTKRKEFKVDCRSLILLLHDNPIYNLAAVETQMHGNIKQTDEINILGGLRKNFRFLFPKSASDEKVIHSIINKIGNS